MAADTMAKRVRLRSKFIWLTALLAGLYGCEPGKSAAVAIPDVYVISDHAGWQKREGRLWLQDSLFSGWQYQLAPTGDTLYKASYSQGQAEGFHRQWFANRTLKEVRQYRKGWQEGEQRGPAICQRIMCQSQSKGKDGPEQPERPKQPEMFDGSVR